MKNKKNLAIASFVMAIISLIPLIVTPDSLTGTEIFTVVGILFAVAAIALGIISRKEAKGFAITGIVIGIITCFILVLALIGFIAIQNAKDCVDNGDGTATCDYLGEELEVPTDFLTDDQMKKGE